MENTISPDPATNTAPVSINEQTIAPGASEWDYLDTPDGDPMGDDRTDFDEEEAPAENEETNDSVKASDTPQTGSEAPTETPKEVSEESSALPDDVAKKVEFFDSLDKALKANPAIVIDSLLSTLDNSQKAEIFAKYGVSQPEIPAFDPTTYEPQSQMEEALVSRWNQIESLPSEINATKTSLQEVRSLQESFVPHVSEANVYAQIALAKLDAICSALNLDIPDPDLGAIANAIKPNVSYRDAVRSVANYTKTVEAIKQSRVERPKTPGNGSRRPEPIPEGTDMLTISRKFGLIR